MNNLFNGSRLSQSNNGSVEIKPVNNKYKATGAQKWWAAVILSLIVVIIMSRPVSSMSNELFCRVFHKLLTTGYTTGQGLVYYFIVFLLIFRLVLW